MHCLLQITHCELTILFHPIHWPITVTYLLKKGGEEIGDRREVGRRKGGGERREDERSGEGRREGKMREEERREVERGGEKGK